MSTISSTACARRGFPNSACRIDGGANESQPYEVTNSLAATAPRRFALRVFCHVIERRVDVLELRLDGFLALLELSLQAGLLLAGQPLKPDVTYCPQAHCFPPFVDQCDLFNKPCTREDKLKCRTFNNNNQAADRRSVSFDDCADTFSNDTGSRGAGALIPSALALYSTYQRIGRAAFADWRQSRSKAPYSLQPSVDRETGCLCSCMSRKFPTGSR